MRWKKTWDFIRIFSIHSVEKCYVFSSKCSILRKFCAIVCDNIIFFSGVFFFGKICTLNLNFNLFQMMICPKWHCIFYKHTENKIYAEFDLFFCQFLMIYFVSFHFWKLFFRCCAQLNFRFFKLDYFILWCFDFFTVG